MIDPLIRHQTFLQRLAGGIYKRVLPALLATSVEARALIVNEADIAGILRKQSELEAVIRRNFAEFETATFDELVSFAYYEADFAKRLLEAAATTRIVGLTRPRIEAIVRESVLELVTGDVVRRVTLPQLFAEFSEGKVGEVRRIVSAGALSGRTNYQMAREINGIVKDRSRLQSEALVRTATNHIGNQTRRALFEANADVIAEEKILATLDLNTTLICAGRDGDTHPVGQGPMPPFHYGCRTIRVPVIKEQYRIMGIGQRASMDGPVDSRTTYGGWLRKQPKDVQDEILGKERATLFRSGKVKLGGFTDRRGVVYSLDELRAREGLTLQ